MKLSLISCSLVLAFVVVPVPDLVAPRAKPKVPRPGLDEKFVGTVHVVQTQNHTNTKMFLIFNFNTMTGKLLHNFTR